MATKGVVDYKARRHIHYFSSGGTWEKGTFVCAATGTNASGLAFDNANRFCYVAASPSGVKPLGMSEAKVVNIDLTRQKLNPFDPNEIQLGMKPSVIWFGYADTNLVSGAPAAQATAYLASNGYVSPTQLTSAPTVGKFLTSVDGNGYAVVQIEL